MIARRSNIRRIAAALPAVLLISSTAASASNPRSRVMLVSFDGLRADVVTDERMPVLANLARNGAIAVECLNECPPVTLVNHASMVTGLRVVRHGVVLNTDLPGFIAWPTIFDVAAANGLRVGFFAGKSKLGYLCRPESAVVRTILGDSQELAAAAEAAIESQDLDLVFFHFPEPDVTGHRDGWMSPQYLDAASRMDALFGCLVEALARAGVGGQTLIIVTADHGGLGRSHAFDIPVVRRIPFILHGPGIAPRQRLERRRSVVDAAAVAADRLGLVMEDIDGTLDGLPFPAVFAPCFPPGDVVSWLFASCGAMPIGWLAADSTLIIAVRGRTRIRPWRSLWRRAGLDRLAPGMPGKDVRP